MLTFNSVENPGRRIDYGFLGNNCILTKEFDIAVVMAGLPLWLPFSSAGSAAYFGQIKSRGI